jgi:hypothetical protein
MLMMNHLDASKLFLAPSPDVDLGFLSRAWGSALCLQAARSSNNHEKIGEDTRLALMIVHPCNYGLDFGGT